MPARALYRKLDFVDYFKAFAQIRDEWIEQFISHPKCLIALEAFVTNGVVVGRVVHFLAAELPKLDRVGEKILLQSARRYFLPKEDARHIKVDEDVKMKYVELLPDASTKGTKSDFWSSDCWPPRSIQVHEESKKTWDAICRQNQAQYLEYWKVANYREYAALFGNGPLLAKIDAFNRRLDDMEPWDHVADIEHLASSDLPSLEASLRPVLLAHLSRDIRFGLVDIPTGLQTAFPQVYAERGIS
jgi:hypothetical protein